MKTCLARCRDNKELAYEGNVACFNRDIHDLLDDRGDGLDLA